MTRMNSTDFLLTRLIPVDGIVLGGPPEKRYRDSVYYTLLLFADSTCAMTWVAPSAAVGPERLRNVNVLGSKLSQDSVSN